MNSVRLQKRIWHINFPTRRCRFGKRLCCLYAAEFIAYASSRFTYWFVNDLLNQTVIDTGRVIFYSVGSAVAIALIVLTTWFQYNATYTESGKRRISLAEQLRKIPLSFFEKRSCRLDQHDYGGLYFFGTKFFSLYSGIGRFHDFHRIDCHWLIRI